MRDSILPHDSWRLPRRLAETGSFILNRDFLPVYTRWLGPKAISTGTPIMERISCRFGARGEALQNDDLMEALRLI
jgi:hypothetical protein